MISNNIDFPILPLDGSAFSGFLSAAHLEREY